MSYPVWFAHAAGHLLLAEISGTSSSTTSERSTTVNNSDRKGMSIFEAAGGQQAFLRLAAAHHQRCLADPVLSHPFSHPGHPQHLERLAAYWAEVFGGPPTYTQEAGGHSFMLALHAGTQADADLGTRFVRCFVDALDDAGLPTNHELRSALRAYMESAVRDVMSYAPADAVVPAGRPVPRWTWAGLQADPGR
jgi:hemoglobin